MSSLPRPAMSYAIYDVKWGTPVLGESGGMVEWDSALAAGLAYDETLYELAHFEAALDAAFQAWEDVADIDFVETESGDPDVFVSMGALQSDTIGLARITFIERFGTDQMVEADITLDSEEFWSPFGESALNFYAVALHEIGHVIGLAHVDDPSQIMHEFLFASDLGEGDIEGAQLIYGPAGPDPFQTDIPPEIGLLTVFARFFEMLASLFGFGSGSEIELAKPPPWGPLNIESLEDIIDVTEIIDDERGNLVTVIIDDQHHAHDELDPLFA